MSRVTFSPQPIEWKIECLNCGSAYWVRVSTGLCRHCGEPVTHRKDADRQEGDAE